MATSTPGKPNILFVMADDVGWFNVRAYHRGMMAGRTPNLDRLGGVDKITASGPVYKLASVTDFAGRYTQSTGKAGFSSSGSSDLWLENGSGVIMHLEGTSSGAMLTLGKDEIFIRMNQ